MDILKNSALSIVLVLMISSFVMPLMKTGRKAYWISFSTMAIAFVLSILNYIYIGAEGPYTYKIGHFNAPFGITFRIGTIEGILGILFTFVALMVLWYSYYSIEKEIKPHRMKLYYTLINLLIASLLGIVFTGDIFNGFVFIEVSTLAACGIIIVKDKKENIKATMKYLILSSLGSGLFLMGIAYLYSMTGHLDIESIGKIIQGSYEEYPKMILISLSIITIGLGIKSAMFPLHVWLPDAHSTAPSTSSALLSALVIKASVVMMFKVLYQIYGIEILQSTYILKMLLLFGGTGMIMGSLFARFQKDIKRMVAYSSVAQMGYIFFGMGLGNTLGFTIAFYHIIAHALTKSALFLAVGSMIEQTGEKKIEKLRGIGKEMPVTLAIFTLGALSMVGIPVLPGFISKWNLALATIDAGSVMLLGVILLSSLLNAAYYFPIIINGYFGEKNLEGKVFRSKSKPVKELIPVIVLAVALILAGFVSGPILQQISLGL